MSELTDCEACGTKILNRFDHNFHVDIPVGDSTYEQKAYMLCEQCRIRIVDWIEGFETPEDVRVEPLVGKKLNRSLRNQAKMLERMADEIMDDS